MLRLQKKYIIQILKLQLYLGFLNIFKTRNVGTIPKYPGPHTFYLILTTVQCKLWKYQEHM